MQYDIRLVKLVSGETVMGQYDSQSEALKDVVLIQTIPTGAGVQLAILPYGFPLEEDVGGEIAEKYIIYTYSKIPEELSKKYLEAKSNIRIASSLDPLGNKGSGGILL
ncbi:MAG: hypothetical protein LBD73_02375 [Deferribacteraceae bacterium]|jgi:hypothetical protein|nr:hypothetical protein [Deferribacteraceae bacterium]